MNQSLNHAYAGLVDNDPNKRYDIVLGGRGAGRSHAMSQTMISKLIGDGYFRAAAMRYVQDDVRESIFRSILDRAEEQDVKDNLNVFKNEMRIAYGNNYIIGKGFRRADGSHTAKMKSLADYNYIGIDEADEVAEADFMQLDDTIRTKKGNIRLALCLNPPHKSHWIIKTWFDLEESGIDGYYVPRLKRSVKNVNFMYTNFRQNFKNLDLPTVKRWLEYKERNPEHYYTMIEGLISEGLRGRIYKTWQQISTEEYEKLPYPVFYGLDFGFSNDVAALVEIKQHNDTIYIRQLIYETNLTNPLLAQRFSEIGVNPDAPIYADAAEPKSIQELQDLGWNVLPAIKSGDSIRAGVNHLLSKIVKYTDDSEGVKDELQNYTWALNRDKDPTNTPNDAHNHAMDAIRYGVMTKKQESTALVFA